MQLVLVRHGQSEWNRLNLFTGWTDVDLSHLGLDEATRAGRALHAAGFDFDVCHTSVLKRAIRTLNSILGELDREWLPVHKSWKLNERHYGALQGLNKAETAERYGEDQVRVWRRSFAVPPPPLDAADNRNPRRAAQYRDIDPTELPLTESLKDTIARVMPYYHGMVEPDLALGRRVLVVSHGNAIRGLVKHLDDLSDAEVAGVEIPTGVPLVYELDDSLRSAGKRYLVT